MVWDWKNCQVRIQVGLKKNGFAKNTVPSNSFARKPYLFFTSSFTNETTLEPNHNLYEMQVKHITSKLTHMALHGFSYCLSLPLLSSLNSEPRCQSYGTFTVGFFLTSFYCSFSGGQVCVCVCVWSRAVSETTFNGCNIIILFEPTLHFAICGHCIVKFLSAWDILSGNWNSILNMVGHNLLYPQHLVFQLAFPLGLYTQYFFPQSQPHSCDLYRWAL
jgi:hypothetical protein